LRTPAIEAAGMPRINNKNMTGATMQMLDKSHFGKAFLISVGVLTLAAAMAMADPQTESSAFLATAEKCLENIKKLDEDVRSRMAALRKASAIMLSNYDWIVTSGPGTDRNSLAANYERERPAVVAQEVNLDTAARKAERAILRARDFLHDESNAQYRQLATYGELDKLLFKALTAVEESRRIQHPPPLPDPLPTAAVRRAERVDVRYSNLDVKVGVQNQLEVEVKSNCRFSRQKVTVEVRVRKGQATIHDALRKSVELGPRETRVLTWSFTPDADGELHIGARVAETVPVSMDP
jgi:hypothetical protein